MEQRVKSTRNEWNVKRPGEATALFLKLCQKVQVITSVELLMPFVDGGQETEIHQKQIVMLDGLRVTRGRTRRLGTVS